MRYAELHVKSYFSFLRGASSPEELIGRARELGHVAMALTDLNGLYGIVAAREALAEASGLGRREVEARSDLKLLYGAELEFDDDRGVALVRDREGYGQLCSAISTGRRAAQKGEFRLTSGELFERTRGLFLLAGGPQSAVMRLLREGDLAHARRRLEALREAFGERLFVELVRHQVPGDLERSKAMADLARSLGLPVLATNDVTLHARKRKPLADVLACAREGIPLTRAGRRLAPNAEAHLKSAKDMAKLFEDLPEAIERTVALADALRFRLTDVTYSYPAPDLALGENADEVLARLCRKGLSVRLGELAPRYGAALERELGLITELRYAGYFLTMWEVVQLCHRLNILCQGRGSAANSLVCFSLGITSVRPDVIDMLFERFISKERNEPPDIDLDIEHERREEVLQYVYAKYGRRHAGMVAETIRYRRRSAVRDVGKALGFSEEELGRMSDAGLDRDDPKVRQLFTLAHELEGFPRHLSIHVGGFILSGEPLDEIAPIENGRMADRTVIQWNKDDVDAMSMFKLDLLGLGMLTVLAKAFALVREHRQVELTLQTTPPDDPETYAMLQRADTVGVFQVESRAQMNMLPRLQPKEFYDLVIEVALVRPGPIQGQMVHPYLRRRRGQEKVEYPHPKLETILRKTRGVPLFQEQVMRLAEAVGGYTAGEADQLRRDMASWRSDGRMERHRDRLISGMRRSGLTLEFAERVFQQIRGFGAYGFPESHAAAFAHLAYVSAYLKAHFPAEFACALINSQPMGFYSPAVIVNDLKRHGVEVRPVDVQRSNWDCTLEEGALRLGLRLVRNLGEAQGRAIERTRPFASVEDLSKRTGLPAKAHVPLAAAGALRSLHRQRRQALWAAAATARSAGPLLVGAKWPEGEARLPPLAPIETLAMDIHYARTFPGRHPMELVRADLARQGILSAAELFAREADEQVTVAGLVITRQRPKAAGVVFVTLEDETGHADVSVSPGAFLRFQEVIRLSSALIVRGRLVADGRARNVSAAFVTPLEFTMPIRPRSHDFH